MSDSAIVQNKKERAANGLGRFPKDSEDLNEEQRSPVVKGCFIATAALGSELHPHVQLLRDFRDNILLQSRYKTTFENLLDRYYRLSPPIAHKMEQHALIKQLLRYFLVFPIVIGIRTILPFVNIILGIERDAKRRKTEVSDNIHQWVSNDKETS